MCNAEEIIKEDRIKIKNNFEFIVKVLNETPLTLFRKDYEFLNAALNFVSDRLNELPLEVQDLKASIVVLEEKKTQSAMQQKDPIESQEVPC